MNIQQNELFKSGVKNLSEAMDKLQFNDSMTAADSENIRGKINEAKSNISALSDVHPDHNGQFSTLMKMADFLDKSLTAVNSDHLL